MEEDQMNESDKVAALRADANAGDADAQFKVGALYYSGESVPQDYAQAVSWIRKAAEQGHGRASFNLGAMYANGQGVPQDYELAVTWYRKAADQGNATAQTNLGAAYHDGEGVPQDDVEAQKWFALQRGSEEEGGDQVGESQADALTERLLLEGGLLWETAPGATCRSPATGAGGASGV